MPTPPLKNLSHLLAIPIGALLLGLTFWPFNIDPMWAVIAFVLVYDPDTQTALSAGRARFLATLLGSAVALVTIATCGLHKWLMPLGLFISALLCTFIPLFKKTSRIVLVSTALIIGATLLQPSADIRIAALRSLEVAAGSLLAIALSWIVSSISSANR